MQIRHLVHLQSVYANIYTIYINRVYITNTCTYLHTFVFDAHARPVYKWCKNASKLNFISLTATSMLTTLKKCRDTTQMLRQLCSLLSSGSALVFENALWWQICVSGNFGVCVCVRKTCEPKTQCDSSWQVHILTPYCCCTV